MSLIITIIIFGIIVMIHEFGHFIAAVKSGVLVEEFAIGMGPKLLGFKKGETLYSIRLFPIGGYCKMADEDKPDSLKKGFNSISIYKKMIVVLAGVFMNFLLAFVITSILVMLNGYAEPVIREVQTGYPAYQAELMKGDKILKVNNTKIKTYRDFIMGLDKNAENTVSLTIKRNNEIIEKQLTPVLNEEGRYIIGMQAEVRTPLFGDAIDGFEKSTFFGCLHNGFWNMVYMINVMIEGVIALFTFKVSMDEVAGPIGITTVIGSTYQESVKYSFGYAMENMANMVALLSANLGIMNLLPIPALDGGRFLFLIVEFIRRKPIPPEKEGFIHFIGFAVLMAFAVFIAFHDIIKLL